MTFSSIFVADPGGTTGFTYWLASNPSKPAGGWQLPYLEFADWAVEFIHSAQPGTMVVISEDFTINPETHRKPGSRWSLEQIGVLRIAAQQCRQQFVLQDVGDAKKFCPNPVLQQLGWYIPGKVHANDALRHLVLYFARIGWYDGQSFTPRIGAAT